MPESPGEKTAPRSDNADPAAALRLLRARLADGSISIEDLGGALDDHYDFGILVDTKGSPSDTLLITNRTPSDANRVVVSVARFPADSVIMGG